LTEEGKRDIIVIGGDGTLNEVLNGLDNPAECRLGLIPSGTGNDFAEKIGVPVDAEKATALILDGEAKDTDYLNIGGYRCMNVGGIGMDVDVLERCHKGKMKGKPKYVLSLLQSLFTFKGYTVTVTSEGREEAHEALIAAACNGGFFGGGIPICPVADPTDGSLDFLAVKEIKRIKIIGAFLKLKKGKILELEQSVHEKMTEIKIELPVEHYTVNVDGELYEDIPFEVKVVSNTLKVYR
jgi:YegS/Rv2252/BmrU family lipid kinase